ELALACDLRVAAAHVRLSLPEAQWGCFPGAGAPVRLPFLVGPSRALEVIVLADILDAKELQMLGVINRVFESEIFDQSLMAYAEKIASRGPQALRGAKAVIRSRIEPGFSAARRLSDALRHTFEFTPDADEGVLAHMQGRSPKFSGRSAG
ncbi:MAG: enoyl-CoA hydratase/isomerase family protein, partial [Burkholderiales bacterium]|nr:enoyl-CoA hydratase/isomerase family protein [Burkholderiales bacterium]